MRSRIVSFGYTKRMFDDTSSEFSAFPTLDDPDPIRRTEAIRLTQAPAPDMIQKTLIDCDHAVRAAALWRLNMHPSEPRRQLPGFEPDPDELGRMPELGRGKHLRFAGSLTSPNQFPVGVDNMNGSIFVRNVESCVMRHDCLPRPQRAGNSLASRPSLASRTAGSRSAHVDRRFG